MQANEVIKIVSEIGNPLADQLLIYNSLDNSQYKMKLKNTFTKERIELIFEKENYTDLNCDSDNYWNRKEELLISAEKLRSKIRDREDVKIISVIENIEVELPFIVDLKIPLSILEINKINFDKKKEYIIICNKGISSYVAVQRIKEIYPNMTVLSLKNGIINY
jgi:adenylyltransferase/sulfurtransferase